jgi:hypothetical protein
MHVFCAFHCACQALPVCDFSSCRLLRLQCLAWLLHSILNSSGVRHACCQHVWLLTCRL